MNEIERAWRKAEKYGLPEKTHYDCTKCHDTGYCDKCGGEGCMDCRYTGECQQCHETVQIETAEFLENNTTWS